MPVTKQHLRAIPAKRVSWTQRALAGLAMRTMDADVEEQQLFRRDDGNFPRQKGSRQLLRRDVLREQKPLTN